VGKNNWPIHLAAALHFIQLRNLGLKACLSLSSSKRWGKRKGNKRTKQAPSAARMCYTTPRCKTRVIIDEEDED
jgi:hypothetical protein